MTHWLKVGYFTASQEAGADYWQERTWVSDGPGRDSSRWKKQPRPRKGDLYPPWGPRYEVGDRLVIYITERGVCPAIVEVTAPPRWDPAWVDEESGKREGRRWGVVTEIEAIATLAFDDAPFLGDLGIAKQRVMRKGHVWISELEFAAAERLIAGKEPASPKAKAKSEEVPVEGGEVEGYETRTAAKTRAAERREAKLVRDFRGFLEARGDVVVRNKIYPEGARAPLFSDLFNKTRRQLIEAKAGVSRGEIRMAIGQLADYRRRIRRLRGRAVLLEARPEPDLLALLRAEGIAVIWRQGEGFADNAGGRYT